MSAAALPIKTKIKPALPITRVKKIVLPRKKRRFSPNNDDAAINADILISDLPKHSSVETTTSINTPNDQNSDVISLSRTMHDFNASLRLAQETIMSNHEERMLKTQQNLLEKELRSTIENNHRGFLHSQLELTECVKKNGKMILEPKLRDTDTFQTRIKGSKAFNFCVRIGKLARATINVKFELRSFDEISMLIK